ncbi:MAG: peptidylprolyl isomerase, partial [Planctomycetales bacterium]
MASKISHEHKRSVSRRVWFFLGGLVVIAVCIAIRMGIGSEPVVAESRLIAPATQPERQPASQQVVAQVNGQPISRYQLAQECLIQHGSDVLETVMNRHLISLECQKNNIMITDQQIEEELDRVSRRFGLPVDQWLSMLQSERDISPQHYRNEIIWPTVALRKLAQNRLTVSDEEIQQEINARFGRKVQARMITVSDPELADRLQAQAVESPSDFPKLAVENSTDVNSASAGGLIQPIRRHMGEPQVEQAAFALQPDGISPVIQVGNQYVILKCESIIEGR